MEGWRERRGWRIGRFLGVISIVMAKPLSASWLVRSIRGSKCPSAGYGINKICALVLVSNNSGIFLSSFSH